MKKYTIKVMKEFDFMKEGTQKEVFVYANNDFEAGYKLAQIDMSLVIGTHFTKNELVSVEELKPIKVKYTCWTGERDEERVETCYGTLEDAKRQIGGGMNCFDFEIVEE